MTREDEGHFHLVANKRPDAVMVIIDFSADCAGTIRSWHMKDPGALEEVELQKLWRKTSGVNYQVRDLAKENNTVQYRVPSMLRDILLHKVSTGTIDSHTPIPTTTPASKTTPTTASSTGMTAATVNRL